MIECSERKRKINGGFVVVVKSAEEVNYLSAGVGVIFIVCVGVGIGKKRAAGKSGRRLNIFA